MPPSRFPPPALSSEDLLILAASAKATGEIYGDAVYQLGAGTELLASTVAILESYLKAEQHAHRQTMLELTACREQCEADRREAAAAMDDAKGEIVSLRMALNAKRDDAAYLTDRLIALERLAQMPAAQVESRQAATAESVSVGSMVVKRGDGGNAHITTSHSGDRGMLRDGRVIVERADVVDLSAALLRWHGTPPRGDGADPDVRRSVEGEHCFVAAHRPGYEHTCVRCGNLAGDAGHVKVASHVPAIAADQSLDAERAAHHLTMLELTAATEGLTRASAEIADLKERLLGMTVHVVTASRDTYAALAREGVALQKEHVSAQRLALLERGEADLTAEVEYQRARVADLERRLVAANDQAERDTADVLAAEIARNDAVRALKSLQDQVVGAMTDLPSVQSAPADPSYLSPEQFALCARYHRIGAGEFQRSVIRGDEDACLAVLLDMFRTYFAYCRTTLGLECVPITMWETFKMVEDRAALVSATARPNGSSVAQPPPNSNTALLMLIEIIACLKNWRQARCQSEPTCNPPGGSEHLPTCPVTIAKAALIVTADAAIKASEHSPLVWAAVVKQ